LRSGNQIYVVDSENRIRFRDVELLRTERDQIVVGRGIRPGERVCTSPLEAALDGMTVRVVDSAGVRGLAEHAEADPVADEAIQ
jgi:hypothetical protein